MTVNIVSDLHWCDPDHLYPDHIKKYSEIERLDFSKFEPADVLVIAGDLGITYNDYKQVLLKFERLGIYKHIVHCMGNHDYWYDGSSLKPDYKHHSNYILQEYGLIFCCLTMWTPIFPSHKGWISEHIQDYKNIREIDSVYRTYGELITPNKTNIRFVSDINYLRTFAKLKHGYFPNYVKDYKKIIVTHHVPRKELIQDREHLLKQYCQAFCVMTDECKDIKPDIWIFGHDHTSGIVDQKIDDVRYIKNCLRDMDMKIRNNNYNYIIEI